MSMVQAQRQVSKMCLRAASGALAFVVLLAHTPAAAQLTGTAAYKVLHSFYESQDGATPIGSLIRDAKGNLYGTTSGDGKHDWGTVFKVDKWGVERVLHSFNNEDGSDPQGGLVRDKAGNLYGTTSTGGALRCGQNGCGTVFRLAPTGKLTVLHNFTGGTDGEFPLYGSLLMDAEGNLYGTTSAGGAYGRGTVFKASIGLKETVLHSFNETDGAYPTAGLIRDEAGNLYGTTQSGGPNSHGTVFKVDKHGVETVLYSFSGGADGGDPTGGLVRDTSGNLYGTTTAGGLDRYVCNTYGCGVVFKVDATGNETVLYSFCSKSRCEDGLGPWAGLVSDAEGNFYGTATVGGDPACDSSSWGCGVVFKLDKSGKETVLHSFTGPYQDGAFPGYGALLRDTAGDIYGVTYAGGGYDNGLVFKLVP
jgi:uncharacterized repeat protein (TIGR03803 family)